MPKGLFVDGPEHTILQPYQDPPLAENQVRVKTEFASVKHGTLFHIFSGDSPFQNRRFDPKLRMFVETDDATPSLLLNQFIGSIATGEIVAVGSAITRFEPGDRVYCYGPACESLTVAEEDVHILEPPMNELDAVCLDPALFAYAVIRDARVTVGDNVITFGLGAIGLFVVQLLELAGCLNVISVDPILKRRQLAERLGAELVLDPTECDVALETRRYLGQGADIAIEASGHYRALRDAMRSVGQCGRIATLGYYKGAGSELELGAEWHHNRLELTGSMPAWDNPLREHPVWDLERLYCTLVEMFKRGLLSSKEVVDPIVEFTDSAQAFMDIYHDPADAIKLGIRFPP
jgi:threonine dehydrogenase-like Zn-dependent dehydrogenase